MEALLDRLPSQFSSGQRQRVAIALNRILRQLGLHIPYIAEFIGSLAGALELAFVLKKYHIPVNSLPN